MWSLGLEKPSQFWKQAQGSELHHGNATGANEQGCRVHQCRQSRKGRPGPTEGSGSPTLQRHPRDTTGITGGIGAQHQNGEEVHGASWALKRYQDSTQVAAAYDCAIIGPAGMDDICSQLPKTILMSALISSGVVTNHSAPGASLLRFPRSASTACKARSKLISSR